MFGEIFSDNISKFNYLDILKNTLNFQEKNENKNFFLIAISKEIPTRRIANYQSDINENLTSNLNNDLEKDANEKMDKNQNATVPTQTEENLTSENSSQEKSVSQEENVYQNAVETSAIPEEKEYPVQTIVVQDNNLSESYNTVYKDVKIKNETSFNLSQNILTPDVQFTNKNIIIFHTHTCESYTRNKRKLIYSFWKF